MRPYRIFLLAGLLLSGSGFIATAQISSTPAIPGQKQIENTSEFWLGLYTKYRIRERLYYYGEYHLRRREFLDDMAQIYLRFGLSYIVNKNFEFTAGVVTPFYWAPDTEAENVDKVVPQYRGWQQFLFIMPFERLKVYHQLRTEQRWRRDFVENSPFDLTHRFRYKILAYYPLNHHKLENNTLFLSMYEEVFIQAGKSIVYNHLEDNRVFIGLGYILNDNLQFQTGYQWSFRHRGSPFVYENRHMLRISIYHNLDLYQKKQARSKPLSRIDPVAHH